MNLLPDITILPMWLIFMATLLTLNHFVFKPTLAILAERRKRTEGYDKEVNYFNEQNQIKLAEYDSLMNDARNLARGARDEILKEADINQKEIIKEARDAAEVKMTEAQAVIQGQADSARGTLKTLSKDMASQITKKLIDRKVA